ncbi:DUF4372 domain-containing protein [uncultured Desulfovibrio sp.]|uniref:DUF4372 domain-containing protein n=1 Tax=uncultured Desulfovibrio sp. TaxID=167968 RepID=UPI00345CE6ED
MTPPLIPRHIFQKLEHRHKTGRSSRKLGFKEQFIAMAFTQLARALHARRPALSERGRGDACITGPENRGPLHRC